jgi:hypothetical protein
METVLSLRPHDALLAIDDLGGDFFVAVRRQAMHDDRVWPRGLHHVVTDLERPKHQRPSRVLDLLAHRRPHIGIDDVSVPRSSEGVGGHGHAATGFNGDPSRGLDYLWDWPVARWRANRDVHTSHRTSLEQRVRDIVKSRSGR